MQIVLDLLEFVIFHFIDRIPKELTVFPVSIFFFGLYGYNRIQEPIKESGGKQICLAAMIIGGISALVIILPKLIPR